MVRFIILKDSQLSIRSCCKISSSSLENAHSVGATTFSIFKNSKIKLHALPKTELVILELSILLVIFERMSKLPSIDSRWKEMGEPNGKSPYFLLHVPLFHVEYNDRNKFFYQCS